MKMLAALRGLLALTLLSALALAACESGDGGNDPPPDTDANTAASMATRINTLRTDADVETVAVNGILQDIAQSQADYNAAEGINSDTDGDGADLATRLREAGYDFATLAYLFNNLGETASFNEWRANPAYSSILVDEDFTEVGVGTAVEDGVRRWVVIFGSLGEPSNDTTAEMLALINEFRTENGAAELSMEENLEAVAQAQATYNASINMNSDENAEGAPLTEQVENTGYSYLLFMTLRADGDAASAFARWTDTEEERNNLLSDQLQDVGIGVAASASDQWWIVIATEPDPAP